MFTVGNVDEDPIRDLDDFIFYFTNWIFLFKEYLARNSGQRRKM